MKKLIILISIILISFTSFIIFTFLPKNYKYTYKVNKMNITETYDKKTSVYYINMANNKLSYDYSFKHKYSRKRGLIKTLKIKDNCIKATSKVLDNFTLCNEDNEYVTEYYHYDKEVKKTDSFANIDIYNLLNKKYFIWNYTDFIVIDNSKKETINLFKNDIYELDLITKLKDDLVIADYIQKYSFEKLYLINSKNNKVKEINLDRKIYFNSYILGIYKNSLYLYDLEKEIEYKINPFKQTVSKNAFEILNNNKWQKVSVNKLNKKNLQFTTSVNFKFSLEGNILYYVIANNKIKIVDMPVSRLLQSDNKEAYFISEDSLYFVNLNEGITKIMSYSEWNFNNKNIYIF